MFMMEILECLVLSFFMLLFCVFIDIELFVIMKCFIFFWLILELKLCINFLNNVRIVGKIRRVWMDFKVNIEESSRWKIFVRLGKMNFK